MEEDTLAAAFIFERENGRQLSTIDQSVVESSHFSQLTTDQVEKELMESVGKLLDSNTALVGSCLWALGKRTKNPDIHYFKSVLKVLVDSDIEAAYQALIALSNFGELSMGDSAASDHERNYKFAKEYLAK